MYANYYTDPLKWHIFKLFEYWYSDTFKFWQNRVDQRQNLYNHGDMPSTWCTLYEELSMVGQSLLNLINIYFAYPYITGVKCKI